METDPYKKIAINPALNKHGKLLFFIPVTQVVPLGIIAFVSFLLCGIIGADVGMLIVLLILFGGSWLFVSGEDPHEVTDTLISFPADDWINSNTPYIDLDPGNRSFETTKKVPDYKLTAKENNIQMIFPNGNKENHAPFINFQHLVAPFLIQKDGRNIGGFFLEKNNTYQIIFCFALTPWHNHFYEEEALVMLQHSTKAIGSLISTESLTFHVEKYAYDLDLLKKGSEIAKNCKSDRIATFYESELGKTRELSDSHIRQKYTYIITASYTFTRDGLSANTGLIDRLATMASGFLYGAVESKTVLKEDFFVENYNRAYVNGFQEWEGMLKSRWRLDVQPMNHHECWGWLWRKFNGNSAPVPIPSYHYLFDNSFREVKHSDLHPIVVLLRGKGVNEATPRLYSHSDEIAFPARGQKCAVLYASQTDGDLKLNALEQLEYIYKKLQSSDLYDIDITVELNHFDRGALKNQLKTFVNQTNSAYAMSAENGKVADFEKENDLVEGMEAQQALARGLSGLYLAFTITVWRKSSRKLEEACFKISKELEDFHLKREKNLCWRLWLETLPILSTRLLQQTSAPIQDRRLKVDSDSFVRFLPLVAPNKIDNSGLELIEKNGQPIAIELFAKNPLRALLIGESGSGKSVLAWNFILSALVRNIPTVIIDAAVNDDPSFKNIATLVGGSHIDTSKTKINLLEPPDLSAYSGEIFKIRLDRWIESVRSTLTTYIMHGINEPRLEQRVDGLILKTTSNFLQDSEIRRRINLAMEGGWQSIYWQNIPTLKDWLKFCTKERLNLKNFSDIDRSAIDQIRTQVTTLLESPLGSNVGSPSSFNPNAQLICFTLNAGLTNERDQMLIAQTIQAACLRLALTHRESLIVGDEIADLLKKKGFSQLWGAFHAMSRKAGVGMITISQNMGEIQDSAAARDILENISFSLIGRITTKGVKSLVDGSLYPERLAIQNASTTFKLDEVLGCTSWLLEKDRRFWQLRFFPSDLNLISMTNSQTEIAFRKEIMSRHGDFQSAMLEYKQEYARLKTK